MNYHLNSREKSYLEYDAYVDNIPSLIMIEN